MSPDLKTFHFVKILVEFKEIGALSHVKKDELTIVL